MYTTVIQGGPVLWSLLLISLISLALFLDKLFELHRAQIDTRDFLTGLYNILRRGNTVEAVSNCEDTEGPVAQLVRAALLKADEPLEEIAKAVQQAGISEIPSLEHRLNLLATLGKVAPMLGLLGTVLSMMGALQDMHADAPLAHSGDLANHLWHALLSTAAGLAVSIPIYAAYNLLVSRIESLVMDMEYAASDVLAFLQANRTLLTKD
jgi:biopolymer transport protein ExbB